MLFKVDQRSAKILDEAADYIDTHGWTQYDMQDHQGRVCAVGAIRKAATGNAFNYNSNKPRNVIERVNEYGKEHGVFSRFGRPSFLADSALISFNDSSTTRQDDVTRLFRNTAAWLRNGKEDKRA